MHESIPVYDKRREFEAQVAPILNQLRVACQALGLPVVCLVTVCAKAGDEGYTFFDMRSTIEVDGLAGGPHMLAAGLLTQCSGADAMAACDFIYNLPSRQVRPVAP